MLSARKKDADQPAEVLLDVTLKQLEQVRQPRLNERVGVWEFYTTIDPAGLDDGPFEVYALPFNTGKKFDNRLHFVNN